MCDMRRICDPDLNAITNISFPFFALSSSSSLILSARMPTIWRHFAIRKQTELFSCLYDAQVIQRRSKFICILNSCQSSIRFTFFHSSPSFCNFVFFPCFNRFSISILFFVFDVSKMGANCLCEKWNSFFCFPFVTERSAKWNWYFALSVSKKKKESKWNRKLFDSSRSQNEHQDINRRALWLRGLVISERQKQSKNLKLHDGILANVQLIRHI